MPDTPLLPRRLHHNAWTTRDMAADLGRAGAGRGGGKWSAETVARAACRTLAK